jgi:hypothetical protein
LTPASGRQDHTTSPSAARTFVKSAVRVHRIPPRVRDDRDTPLMWDETARGIEVICVGMKSKYFCKEGWTWGANHRTAAISANHTIVRLSEWRSSLAQATASVVCSCRTNFLLSVEFNFVRAGAVQEPELVDEPMTRNGMSTLEIDVGDITPVSVAFAADELVVTLADGRRIATPLVWYPLLRDASATARGHFELMPMGIHWPDLDEDLSVAGMLQGRPAV